MRKKKEKKKKKNQKKKGRQGRARAKRVLSPSCGIIVRSSEVKFQTVPPIPSIFEPFDGPNKE